MNPQFLHNMGLASVVAGVVFLILATVWKGLNQ